MEYKSQNVVCQNCKGKFTIEPDDFNFYEKIKVPPPTFCSYCRLQRRIAFFNDRTLFKRKCEKCAKDIISMYSPDGPYKVFCQICYNNRNDSMEYGFNYNFSQTFFEQFFNLFEKVPKRHLVYKNSNENCEYANHVYHSKNVYLSYAIVRSEDIYYCKEAQKGNKICLDSYNIKDSERGYEMIDVSRIYNSRFLIRSARCIDSAYLFDCVECNSCFMSYNLRNKSYVFRNEQLSRKKYLEAIKDYSLDSYSVQEKLKKEFYQLSKNALCRPAMVRSVENCTGDFIGHSKNAKYCFSNIDTENSKYIIFGANTIRDSYDLFNAGRNQSCYESTEAGGDNSNVKLCLGISTGLDVEYCALSKNLTNCFGCVGLDNKSYCIFNKQYTKEEYEKLLPKIIKHMNEMPYVDKKGRIYKYGEFFPIEFSPFAYNESLAYEEFPMNKEEVAEQGYTWRDTVEKHYKATIESIELPDSINNATDKILEEIIACPNKGQIETKCTFGYRIVPDELRFYRLMKLPLPHYCPNCRYYERKKLKNPWKLWHRTCMCDKQHSHHQGKCDIEFETSYAPKRPEIIYCEKCYQQEVY